MSNLSKPVNTRYYNPLENPNRYPLELCSDHHICLWSEDGKFKWTIAYFVKHKEGYDLTFIGDRPLDSRVNWDHFRELVTLGQQFADKEWENEHKDLTQ